MRSQKDAEALVRIMNERAGYKKYMVRASACSRWDIVPVEEAAPKN